MYRCKGNTKGNRERLRSRPKPEKLARDIAASIEEHRALGIMRDAAFYTSCPDTQALVRVYLGKV
jgi:hypothetical protein